MATKKCSFSLYHIHAIPCIQFSPCPPLSTPCSNNNNNNNALFALITKGHIYIASDKNYSNLRNTYALSRARRILKRIIKEPCGFPVIPLHQYECYQFQAKYSLCSNFHFTQMEFSSALTPRSSRDVDTLRGINNQ